MIRKSGKKKAVCIVLPAMLLLISLLFFCQRKGLEKKQEEIVLKQGQEVIYGQIAAVYGNEISYYCLEEDGIKAETSDKPEGGIEAEKRDKAEEEGSEKRNKPEGGMEAEKRDKAEEGMEAEKREKPEGGIEAEKRDKAEEEGSEKRNKPEGGKLSEKDAVPKGGFWGETEAPIKEGNNAPQELKTVQIPVGTQVITRLGTVTTFSRLAAGDTVKMLVQEEEGEQVILQVWIVE